MKRKFIFFIMILILLPAALSFGNLKGSADYDPNVIISVGLNYNNGLKLRDTSCIRNGYYSQVGSTSRALKFYSTSDIKNEASRKYIFKTDYGVNFVYLCRDINLWQGTGHSYWVESSKLSSDSSAKQILNCHLELVKDFAYSTNGDGSPNLTAVNTEINNIKSKGLNAFAVYLGDKYRVRIGNYDSITSANNDKSNVLSKLTAGSSLNAVGGGSNCITAVNAVNGSIVFEIDEALKWVAVLPDSKDGYDCLYHRQNSVFDSVINDGKYYKGVLNFKRDSKDTNGNKIGCIDAIDMQLYLKGVVPSEIGSGYYSTYGEAYKAQAIIARNYAYLKYLSTTHKPSTTDIQFDICNSTHCQVYEFASDGVIPASANQAVDETKGQFLLYNNVLAQTFYHASNGGYTISSQDAWRGSFISYLTGVSDDAEDLDNSFHKEFTLTELKDYIISLSSSRLKGDSPSTFSDIANFTVEETKAGGVAYRVGITDVNGKYAYVYGCDDVRIVFSKYVRCANFKIITTDAMNNTYIQDNSSVSAINKSNNELSVIDGSGNITTGLNNIKIISGDGSITSPQIIRSKYTIDGKGNGHSVGLSQEGAKGRSKRGETSEQILNHYFQGTTISPRIP